MRGASDDGSAYLNMRCAEIIGAAAAADPLGPFIAKSSGALGVRVRPKKPPNGRTSALCLGCSAPASSAFAKFTVVN